MKTVAQHISTPQKTWYFLAEGPTGPPVLFCRGGFRAPEEREQILSDHPGVLEWKVVKEHLTEEQARAFKETGHYQSVRDGSGRELDGEEEKAALIASGWNIVTHAVA